MIRLLACAVKASETQLSLRYEDLEHAALTALPWWCDDRPPPPHRALIASALRQNPLHKSFHRFFAKTWVRAECRASELLDRERDWSYTRGCPGCVVAHTLDSEFTIRLLYAACLLSDVHYPFTLDGPTLPSFIFFLDSLRDALAKDPLWGEDYFELVAPKAATTRNGIEDLILQCLELDAILSAPTTPATDEARSAAASPRMSPVLAAMGDTPGMKVKRSRMAKQQMRLKVEQEKWVEEMLRCVDSLQIVGEPGLDAVAVAKGGELVTVNEVVPAD